MLQWDFLEDPKELFAFASALGVVIFSIISVIAFAAGGGASILFWIFAVITMLLILNLVFHIYRNETQQKETVPRPKKPAPKKR